MQTVYVKSLRIPLRGPQRRPKLRFEHAGHGMGHSALDTRWEERAISEWEDDGGTMLAGVDRWAQQGAC
jgi:hypothetical protein